MDYVCKVAGNLIINDINLELSYMEIIDLSVDDFKSSPQLRDAVRTNKIELYNPSSHRGARRIKSLPPSRNRELPKLEYENNFKFSDGGQIKENLDSISKKMEVLVSRIDFLITKNIETNDKIASIIEDKNKKNEDIDLQKISYFLDKSLEYQTKIDSFIDKKNIETDKKLDKLIDKLDHFITKGVSANLNDYGVIKSKSRSFDDEPLYVPKITTENIEKSNIKAESIEQQGTDDILSKLREMKNKK
jgi:hypothetical protein